MDSNVSAQFIAPLQYALQSRYIWYPVTPPTIWRAYLLEYNEQQEYEIFTLFFEGAMDLMQIPLNDLQAQYRSIKPEVMAAMEDVLEHMHLFLGPQMLAFEQSFAEYCGCSFGIGLSNGTDALTLALRACNIGSGDEVITVANTFIATIESIALVGAVPVFVDIDPDTYTMDWRQLDSVLTTRTRAIIPVHLYGHPAEMQPVMDFACEHGLRVIEDASQAHGAEYQGQRVGRFGDIGCFSLYCSKNLGAYGEAGICVTNDFELAESLHLLRDHGSKVRYQHEVIGINARLDELQAAILNVKLPHLDQWNAARQAHAQNYSEQLRELVDAVPVEQPWAKHVYYVYVVRVQDRDRFRAALAEEGIATGVHYPIPIHLQPACQQYGFTAGMLPVTEEVTRHIVSLPMYPELTSEQMAYIIKTTRQYCSVVQKVRV
jgi:dTDP-4-amino-4,6-dideoxygalactose transaminase